MRKYRQFQFLLALFHNLLTNLPQCFGSFGIDINTEINPDISLFLKLRPDAEQKQEHSLIHRHPLSP